MCTRKNYQYYSENLINRLKDKFPQYNLRYTGPEEYANSCIEGRNQQGKSFLLLTAGSMYFEITRDNKQIVDKAEFNSIEHIFEYFNLD